MTKVHPLVLLVEIAWSCVGCPNLHAAVLPHPNNQVSTLKTLKLSSLYVNLCAAIPPALCVTAVQGV